MKTVSAVCTRSWNARMKISTFTSREFVYNQRKKSFLFFQGKASVCLHGILWMLSIELIFEWNILMNNNLIPIVGEGSKAVGSQAQANVALCRNLRH